MIAAFKTLAVAVIVLSAGVGRAALPIDLEVAVVKAAPLGAMQQWGQRLSELGLAGLRLRGAHAGDKPSITPVGSGGSQRFRVLAVLNHRDQLILPGGAFGHGDMAKLRQFFEAMPGKIAEQGVERGIFGLTRPQFEQLYTDFSKVVTGSTKGVPLPSALASLTAGLSVPLVVDPETEGVLNRAKPLALELREVTTGTAIALALRSAGLALLPEQPPGKPFVVRVIRLSPQSMTWPVGWKPEQPPRQVAPDMYRFTTIEITGYTLAQALQAFTPHMGIPLIFDEHVITQRKIHFAKVEVKFPNRKTYIRRAVDHILSQGHLTGELRVDEGNRPFYWITQFGPESPRALGTGPATPSAKKRTVAAP
jgi:hypothetical protein